MGSQDPNQFQIEKKVWEVLEVCYYWVVLEQY
jgi:hypothetical protein